MTNEPNEPQTKITEIMHESAFGLMSLPTTDQSNLVELDEIYGDDE